MATLTGRIDAEIEVQDQSKQLGNYTTISKARSRRTTLQTLVEYSRIPLDTRPIVNALNLPMPPGLRPEHNFPFSSEHVAWLRTLGNSFCFDTYPTSHMRWSLVAFNGALHYLHIDSDGFGTWLEVKHGLKLWVIVRPKDGSASGPVPSFTEIDGFLKFFGQGDLPNSDRWDVEAVVLKPGSRLIMAPNTMHAVWTMENSICYGGHFYSVATLLPTVVGGGVLAASADKEHLPDFEDAGMFAGTFALLCFMELQNVLDFRSYICPDDDASSVWYRISVESMTSCDVNAIPHEERLECIYTRGLALELAAWVFAHYDILPQTGPQANRPLLDPWADFYWPYLAYFLAAIGIYKYRYPDAVSENRGCDLELLTIQLNRCVDNREELKSACSQIDQASIKSIAPPFPFSIVKREEPRAFHPDTPEALSAIGFRQGDRLYTEAYKEALAHQARRRRAEQPCH
ncbi:hypothetical protein BKA70DRAFT_1437414 [Coprinopsis sp. MPI-PUGE-AT-0042]|nr:hypothetical protein BKA70DRAFT_1437414 [Coprinopsis sp. MPI-PUGE-AT-0042]